MYKYTRARRIINIREFHLYFASMTVEFVLLHDVRQEEDGLAAITLTNTRLRASAHTKIRRRSQQPIHTNANPPPF